MDKETIKQLGLSDNETEVYLLLLQMQEGLASEIAKKSKISRPHIYDTLAKLIDKGIVSYVIKNSRKYFKPANPEVLMDLLKSKEMSLQKILPDLKKLYAPAKEKPTIEVYEGKEGLKTILKDILRVNKELTGFGPTIRWEKEIPIAIEQYFKQREKTGLKAKLLCSEGTEVIKHPLNKYKIIPKDYSSPSSVFTYGNKTCFILWLDSPIAILVENKDLTDSFKGYFSLAWGAESVTYTGKEGIVAFLEDILKTKPEEYLVMGSSGNILQVMPKYRMEWDKKRVAAGIKIRRLYHDTAEARKSAQGYAKSPLRESRFVPMGGESPFATIIYADKVWVVAWSIKNPLLVLIKNKHIAQGFRNQFEQLWHQEERIYHGLEGVKNVLMQALDEKPKELFIYGSSGVAVRVIPEFIEKWHKKRIKNKVKTRILYTESKESRERLKILKEDPYFDYRLMPGAYPSTVATLVYDDKIVLMAIMKDGFATVIKKKEIADIYRKQFDNLWNISKKN